MTISKWSFGSAIDQGDRDHQEDAFVILPTSNDSGGAFVCDGLGGHAGGAEASTSAAKALTGLKWSDIENMAINTSQDFPNLRAEPAEPIRFSQRRNTNLTTVAGFLYRKNEIAILSCGDSQVLIFEEIEPGDIRFRTSAIVEGINNAVYDSWSPYKSSLLLGDRFKLQYRTLIIVASDGINPILGSVPAAQSAYFRQIWRGGTTPINMSFPQAFLDTLASATDPDSLAKVLVQQAVANTEYSDNTTVICAFYEPVSSEI